MSFPPHLPPPVCSVSRHHQWQRLKIIGVATFFGLSAGVSGAAVLLGWIWPWFGSEDTYLSARHPGILARQSVEDQAVSRMAEKVFALYQKSSLQGGVRLLSSADHIADGVVGVTSGWLIAYLPQFDGRFRDWAISGPNGTLYRAVKVLADKRSGAIYVKIARFESVNSSSAAEQFKVATFAEVPEKFDDVFVRQGGRWFATFSVGAAETVSADSRLDAVPSPGAGLAAPFKNGSLAIDAQGNLIGLVVNDNALLPITPLTRVLGGIEDRTRITYQTLGVEGWYSGDRPFFVNGEQVAGFLVNRVVTPKSLLKKGDIILEVNGRPMAQQNLWYTIGDKTVRLKIMRNNKELEIEAMPVEL
ncbi:MAG: hypothetical protein HY983_02365 [Candidatus Magasanikbacteria bacterium]|nr:hypothetical protein [Candidatus Magasanikbacteria bacterium]